MMWTRVVVVAAIGVCELMSGSARADVVAIVKARIHTMGAAGEIHSGTVLMRDGAIAGVGAAVDVPADARIIDARGGIVTPGFVALDTPLAAVEINQIAESVDARAHAQDVSAGLDVAFAVNPRTAAIPIARLGGITRAIVTPDYDNAPGHEVLFAGQAVAIHLGADAQVLVRRGVAMVLDLGEAGAERAGGSRASQFATLQAALEDVHWYVRNRAAYDRGAARHLHLSRIDLDALVPVIEGRMPLIVGAHRADDIQRALELARVQKLKIILKGAEEGWRVAGEIAAAGVGVMLDPLMNLPRSFEMLGATLENAAILHSAGVPVAFTAHDGGAYRIRELRYGAGVAVAHGMPYEAALAALTATPSALFGLLDRVGTLETGKDADVVLWSGDPLEPLSQPLAVFIRGREQSLTTRATQLRDRYLQRSREIKQ